MGASRRAYKHNIILNSGYADVHCLVLYYVYKHIMILPFKFKNVLKIT